MNIIIDNKEIEIFIEDKNIVDVATREKVILPAPCYRSNKSNGCCNVCVVEVDGRQVYACATKPEDGMNIVVFREDLVKIRKEKIKIYNQTKAKGCQGSCDCPSSKSSGGCCSERNHG